MEHVPSGRRSILALLLIGFTCSTLSTSTQSPGSVSPPTGLQAQSISDTRIDLTWSGSASIGTRVHIERSPDGTHWSEIANGAAARDGLQILPSSAISVTSTARG